MCTKVAKFILEINKIHNYTHTQRQTPNAVYSTIYMMHLTGQQKFMSPDKSSMQLQMQL